MTKLKLRKIGNSTGVILPNDILLRLHINEGDELCLSIGPDGIHLTPYDPEFEETMKAFEEGRKQYRNALKELAK